MLSKVTTKSLGSKNEIDMIMVYFWEDILQSKAEDFLRDEINRCIGLIDHEVRVFSCLKFRILGRICACIIRV
jgi:hypothetical protein